MYRRIRVVRGKIEVNKGKLVAPKVRNFTSIKAYKEALQKYIETPPIKGKAGGSWADYFEEKIKYQRKRPSHVDSYNI